MGDSVHVWIAPAGAEPRTAAHNLLISLASSLLGGTPYLTHDPTGRPHIPGLAVSISHTHHLTAVAASFAGPLGVDLEELHPRDVSALASRWFDPTELEWMATQPDELQAFLHLWTAKEAVGKALGAGLRNSGLRRPMPLPTSPVPPGQTGRVDAPPPEGQSLRAGLVPGEAGLAVLHIPVAEAVLAVAISPAAVEIVVHQEAALRSAGRSRTSFPVVVRGS